MTNPLYGAVFIEDGAKSDASNANILSAAPPQIAGIGSSVAKTLKCTMNNCVVFVFVFVLYYFKNCLLRQNTN